MIFIIIFFLVIGFVTAFLSGIVANLSQEQYNLLTEQKSTKYLQKIWDKYDETMHSLFLIGIFFVSFAVFIFGYFQEATSFFPVSIFISAAVFIIGTLLFSLFFFYLGKRLTDKFIIKSLAGVYFITAVFVPLVGKFTNLFVKISGKESEDATMEEITDLVEEAREEGSIDAGEYRLLKNVMNFNDILISDVMTPRIVLFSCKASATIAETIKLPELQIYSRFPIWNGESLDDEIVGYVTTKEIFSAALAGNMEKTLKDLARNVHFIPENAELGKALDTFLVKKQHLFLVVDEYGGVEGLLTMEDVIETMLGVEIVDEADKVVDLRLLAKHRRELRLKQVLPLIK